MAFPDDGRRNELHRFDRRVGPGPRERQNASFHGPAFDSHRTVTRFDRYRRGNRRLGWRWFLSGGGSFHFGGWFLIAHIEHSLFRRKRRLNNGCVEWSVR